MPVFGPQMALQAIFRVGTGETIMDDKWTQTRILAEKVCGLEIIDEKEWWKRMRKGFDPATVALEQMGKLWLFQGWVKANVAFDPFNRIDHAWMLVDAMDRPEIDELCLRRTRKNWFASFGFPWCGHGGTAAEAICAAALQWAEKQ